MLVYKIYQRPALVDAQSADPAGRRNAQLLHDGGGPHLPDSGKGFEQFGHLHPGKGIVFQRRANDVRRGPVTVSEAFLGCRPGGPRRCRLAQGLGAFRRR